MTNEKLIGCVVENLIFPLLNEYDINIWKFIDYIPLADAWVDLVEVCNGDEDKLCKGLKKWILNQVKEEMMMTHEKAIDVLKNAAFLGTETTLEKVAEAVSLAAEALEKQIPKKVVIAKLPDGLGGVLYTKCSVCGWGGEMHSYCPSCGQAIDWGVKNDE